MEAPTPQWFPDSGLELSSLIPQWEMSSLDDQFTDQHLWKDFHQSLSSESYNSYAPFDPTPAATLNTANENGSLAEASNAAFTAKRKGSKRNILSFGNPDSPAIDHESGFYEDFMGGVSNKKEVLEVLASRGSKRRYALMVDEGPKKEKAVSRPPSCNQDHIIAERKRREKLSQRFIALSAIVPGLKKTDKASVLGDAINYLKELQERVRTLEDQSAKRTVECALLENKPQPATDEDSSSNVDEVDGSPPIQSLPTIDVKLCKTSVLVKIQCENHKGAVTTSLSEIENLHVTIINVSVIPFAGSSLDITIAAQINNGCSITTKEIVAKLNTAFRQSM